MSDHNALVTPMAGSPASPGPQGWDQLVGLPRTPYARPRIHHAYGRSIRMATSRMNSLSRESFCIVA